MRSDHDWTDEDGGRHTNPRPDITGEEDEAWDGAFLSALDLDGILGFFDDPEDDDEV